MSVLKTVRQIVDYAAEKYGDKDFCRFLRNGEINAKSFVEFREDCLAVCRYIRTVEADKVHIAFLGRTNYEYVACLTGMMFSGNTVAPFAPDITVEEACQLFDDADIEILFCEEDFAEKAKEIQSRYPALRKIISLGDYKWFEDIFNKYNSQSEYAWLSDVEIDPDECALLIYTSGTTGVRKGVMLSNSNLASNTCYDAYNLDGDDVCISILPMHHVFCYSCDVLKNLYDGAVLCLNGDLSQLYRNLLIFEPTIVRIVPAICKSVLTKIKVMHRRHPELSPREAADLVVGKNFRRMIAGSAFLSGALIDELEKYSITARQGYGMSECSPRITTADFSENYKYSNGILTGVDEVREVDGEIQVKGPSVMLGYYKKPEETAAAFTEDGFLHTGDLGYIENGYVYLVGRKKNLIILSNGENISPEEIENRFVDDAIIKEIVVTGENDRLIANIFPDADVAALAGIEDIEAEIEKIIDRINADSKSDRQIHTFKIRKTPFKRTSTGKIKRTSAFFDEEETGR